MTGLHRMEQMLASGMIGMLLVNNGRYKMLGMVMLKLSIVIVEKR